MADAYDSSAVVMMSHNPPPCRGSALPPPSAGHVAEADDDGPAAGLTDDDDFVGTAGGLQKITACSTSRVRMPTGQRSRTRTPEGRMEVHTTVGVRPSGEQIAPPSNVRRTRRAPSTSETAL